MNPTNSGRTHQKGNRSHVHLLMLVPLTITLIGSRCNPSYPEVETVELNDAIDFQDCDQTLCYAEFFLGSGTRSYEFTLDISGMTRYSKVTVGSRWRLQSPGLNVFENNGAHMVTRVWGGNRAFVTLSRNSVDAPIPTIKLRQVRMNLPATSGQYGGDVYPSCPLSLGRNVHLIHRNEHEALYLLGMRTDLRELVVSLDHPGRIVINECGSTREAVTVSTDPNYSSETVQLGAPPHDLCFMVNISSGNGTGIARFRASQPLTPLIPAETQILDYQKAANAGASFLSNRNVPIPLLLGDACRLGQGDAAQYAPSSGQQGVVFAAQCPPFKLDANPEAYRGFELKNGWQVLSVTKKYSVNGGSWFDSEEDAERDALDREFGKGDQDCPPLKLCRNIFRDRQGFGLLEEPTAGSTKPYLKAHISADPPSPPDTNRALWVTVQITIQGPRGTSPYGGVSPCGEGYRLVDLPNGPACIEHIVEPMDAYILPLFRCNGDADCAQGYLCVDGFCSKGKYR